MYLLKHFYIFDVANNTANNFNYKQLLMFENKISDFYTLEFEKIFCESNLLKANFTVHELFPISEDNGINFRGNTCKTIK